MLTLRVHCYVLAFGPLIHAMVPFQDPGGQTAVFWAAMEGHAEALDWLLEHGAPVDATNEGGQTALMGAAMR